MINPKVLIEIIISFLILGLIGFGINWYISNRELKLREDNAKLKGEIIILHKEDSIHKANIKFLTNVIDSTSKTLNLKDTLILYKNHEVYINRLRNLSIDSSIIVCSDWLAQEASNR